MALIRCPECSTEVSDKADKCPKCAYPIKQKQQVEVVAKEGCFLQTLNTGCMIIAAIIGLIVLLGIIGSLSK